MAAGRSGLRCDREMGRVGGEGVVVILLRLLMCWGIFFKFFLSFVPLSSLVTVRASLILCVGWSDFFFLLGWVC